ncbi:hypothetical protein [Anabaena catenula]|jgi:hypothetical protein|uniref:Uncharacterized protein n=1 Tax=Anabaena catenula FACHB-362 TaxID=2692877 RepID=A0ABR8JBF5_9NOST|nr:hypothetical protein [Anabaena catenula]MBD2694845.1 hypothetical protein [Anabaena catenula FACHB-362]
MKIRGNWGCFQIFLSGLVSAIAINYLITGFIDIVFNIDKLLTWLQRSGIAEFIYRLFGGR